MLEPFRQYLDAHGSFTAAERDRINGVAVIRHLERGDFLLQQGQVCRFQSFVVSGTLRLYRSDEEGGERINAVAPSFTATDATADLVKSEAIVNAFADRMPLGRPAQPADIAAVVAFLAGPDAGFVNGAILPVDGGVFASNGQPNFLALMGEV